MTKPFIAVGENIHCTRIYKVGGLFVKNIDGREVILYRDGDEKKQLPIPSLFTEVADWENGKVKHAAVGIWQGMNGADEDARNSGRAYISAMARRQEASDASFLDLNVDEFSTDVDERVAMIEWATEVIQDASNLPLSIDSSNMQILQAGLAKCDASHGKPMVNSVSLERLEAVEISKDGGAVVIAGAAGEDSMPNSTDDRLANVEKLMTRLLSAGFQEKEIYLDPLVFPISVDPKNGTNLMDAIEELRNTYGAQIHFAPGLSNISFGMPQRKLLNQVFSWLCRERGLDGGIVDPLQINSEILDNLDSSGETFGLARDVLVGSDEYGMNFISASREGKLK